MHRLLHLCCSRFRISGRRAVLVRVRGETTHTLNTSIYPDEAPHKQARQQAPHNTLHTLHSRTQTPPHPTPDPPSSSFIPIFLPLSSLPPRPPFSNVQRAAPEIRMRHLKREHLVRRVGGLQRLHRAPSERHRALDFGRPPLVRVVRLLVPEREAFTCVSVGCGDGGQMIEETERE